MDKAEGSHLDPTPTSFTSLIQFYLYLFKKYYLKKHISNSNVDYERRPKLLKHEKNVSFGD